MRKIYWENILRKYTAFICKQTTAFLFCKYGIKVRGAAYMQVQAFWQIITLHIKTKPFTSHYWTYSLLNKQTSLSHWVSHHTHTTNTTKFLDNLGPLWSNEHINFFRFLFGEFQHSLPGIAILTHSIQSASFSQSLCWKFHHHSSW